CTGRRGPDDYW
nr:immunoglobulin heavy chain junction region [Macaca mulatta]MOW32742.1 immunoglobulin heavy chain junction region [Macaca mulatta]MOW33510.1 immunoglobulin heavy chain junction region [Macaca mulatta]